MFSVVIRATVVVVAARSDRVHLVHVVVDVDAEDIITRHLSSLMKVIARLTYDERESMFYKNIYLLFIYLIRIVDFSRYPEYNHVVVHRLVLVLVYKFDIL